MKMTSRDYKAEYKKYHSKASARKKRSDANKARRKLGLKVGDPRHAGHIKRGGGNGASNIRPQSAKSNMSHGGKIGNRAGKAAGGRKSKR
jgi:hypothetical protein